MAARTETSSSSDSGRRGRGSGRGKRRVRRHGTKRDSSTSSSSRSSSSSSSRGKRKARSSSRSPRRRNSKKGRSRSRDRSGSNAKKGRKRRKRSSSPKKSQKPQGAGPRAQVTMPSFWGAPQMWPISGAPGQTAQANQKEKKKPKKDKKEKKVAEARAEAAAVAEVRAEVAALQTQLKASEAKLQASNSRAESLSADLDAERGTKESLAKELAAARVELSELREGGILQAADIQAELEAAWAPTIDALEARLRATNQELRVAARNIEERDSRIRKLGETLAARAVQIGSLTKARECLLTTITRMKQKHAALRVKYLEEAQAPPGSLAPEGEVSEATAASTAATASSSSTATAAPASASAAPKQAAMRAQAKVPAGPLPHRTMGAPSPVLRAPGTRRRRAADGAEANGQGNGHITFTEGALEVLYEITSFRDLGKQLWVQKPGTKVYCDQCLRRVPQARGNLQQDPTRSQFSQERFLCEECNSAALALTGAVVDGEQSTGSGAGILDAADGSQAAAPKAAVPKPALKRHRVGSRAAHAPPSRTQNGVPAQGVNEAAAAAPASAVAASAAAAVAAAPAAVAAPPAASPASTSASASGASAEPAAAPASVAGAGKEVGTASASSATVKDAKPVSASNTLKSAPSFAELLTETCRAAAAQTQQQ